MLSEVTLREIANFISLGGTLKFLPYKVTHGHRFRLTTVVSKWQGVISAFIMAVQCTQAMFLICTFTNPDFIAPRECTTEGPYRVLHFMWMYLHTYSALLQCIYRWRQKDFIVCINLCFSAIPPAEVPVKMTPLQQLVEILVKKAPSILVLSSALMTVTFFITPYREVYLFSKLPSHLKNVYTVVLCGAYEMFLIMYVHFLTFYAILMVIMYTSVAHDCLQQMRLISKGIIEGFEAHDRFLPLSGIVKNYKALQLLNGVYNQTFCKEVIPNLLIAIIILHSLSIYVDLKVAEVLHITSTVICMSWSFNFILVELVLILKMGQIKEMSKSLIRVLRGSIRRDERKHFCFLMPIGFNVNGVMKKNTALVFVLIVCRISKHLLLID